MKLKITKEQGRHLKSIKWLFNNNENRREGRSLTLALVYIENALKGFQIRIVDHAFITGAGFRANKYLADRIQEIISDNKLPLEISHQELILKLIGKKPRH